MIGRGPVAVAVTYNSARHIPDFLAAMTPALERVGGRMVIADNASVDNTVELVRSLDPSVEVIECGANLGYSGGFNRAMEQIGLGGPIVLVNPDCRPDPDAIHRLVTALETEPTLGVTLPRFVHDDGTTEPSLRRPPTLRRQVAGAMFSQRLIGGVPALSELILETNVYASDCTVAWGTGAFVAMSAECLRRVGRWADHLFLYAEETDFMLRTADAGLRVGYVAGAEVLHQGGDLHTNPRLYSLAMRNAVELERMRHGQVRAQMLRIILVLGLILRIPLRRRRPMVLPAIRALLGSQQAAVRRAGGSAVAGPGPKPRAPRPGWGT